MRVCVFGAGAVGGHVAARLAAHGHAVSVVARGAHREAIERNGITLLSGEEVIRAPVRTGAPAPQDAVIVTLKANALAAFAEAAKPWLAPGTTVVFAQNGIPWWYADELQTLDPGRKLARAIPRGCIAGAAVYSANEVIEPGVVRNFVPGNNMLVIGQAHGEELPALGALRRALEESGMSSPRPPDIRDSVWAKLVQNLASSGLCLLTEATVSELAADAELAALGKRLRAEGEAIAAACGAVIARAPQRPKGGHVSGATGHRPSLLQDYLRGRPMEIEAQLRAPLALARSHGVSTPTLEVVVPLAAGKAKSKGLF